MSDPFAKPGFDKGSLMKTLKAYQPIRIEAYQGRSWHSDTLLCPESPSRIYAVSAKNGEALVRSASFAELNRTVYRIPGSAILHHDSFAKRNRRH
jgi:hypothetical protein